jgi:hypothetical protein
MRVDQKPDSSGGLRLLQERGDLGCGFLGGGQTLGRGAGDRVVVHDHEAQQGFSKGGLRVLRVLVWWGAGGGGGGCRPGRSARCSAMRVD